MNEEISQVKKKFYKKWWFWVLAVIVLLVVVSNIGDSTSSTGSTATSQEAEQVVPIKVSAEALRKAYATNQVSADQQYEDKLVEISGTVDTIGKDILDEAYITFETKEQYAFDKVQCMFSASEENSIANFKKGQSIVVHGKVSGVVISGPIVRNCKVISS
jgi:hypothetical protein